MPTKTIPYDRMKPKEPKTKLVEQPRSAADVPIILWYPDAKYLRIYCDKLCAYIRTTAPWKTKRSDLHPSTLVNLWDKQGGLCALSGLQMQIHQPHQASTRQAMVDIKVPKRGNVRGNVRLVCRDLALARRVAMSKSGDTVTQILLSKTRYDGRTKYKSVTGKMPAPNAWAPPSPHWAYRHFNIFGAIVCAYREHFLTSEAFRFLPVSLDFPAAAQEQVRLGHYTGHPFLSASTYLVDVNGYIETKQFAMVYFPAGVMTLQYMGSISHYQEARITLDLADPQLDICNELDKFILQGYRSCVRASLD